MTTTNLAADLRHLANLIDAHPELGLTTSGPTGVFLRRFDEGFVTAVRHLSGLGLGSVAKDRATGVFTARLRLNSSFELIALDYDEEVACELVQTGTRTVERPVLVQTGVETVEEPVMEWVCPPSILAAATS